MKTTINNIKHLCALLLTALTLAACSGDTDEIVNLPEPSQPTADGIRFTALFDVKNAGTTRALTDPGDGTLTASWQVGEEIAIVFGGAKYTAEVTAVNDGIATVSATLPNGTPNNQTVTFIYPAWAANDSGVISDLLSAQDGMLATISSYLDVATATGSLIVNGTEAMPNGTVTLENQYAICKFQFKDETDAAIIDINKLTITDLSTTETITVTTLSPQSAVYVAMKPSQNSTKFVVEGSGVVYKKIANSNLQAGMFYHPTLAVSYDAEATPLILEAIESGTISFQNKAAGPVYYSIDGGGITTIPSGETGTTPTLSAGQKVAFYGDNSHYATGVGAGKLSQISFSADCYAYGNIMSLISSTNFPSIKTLTDDYTFTMLFMQSPVNDYLKSHPNKTLLLPATTLTSTCYYSMFQGCSGLTNAPDLPATALEQYCYAGMFLGCTSLTKAPALPATTLARFCYSYMFSGCEGLTKAPDLPATTLVDGCYGYMFAGCLQLNSVKCLATNIPATGYTDNWLNDVALSGTFTKAAGVAWGEGANGIPSGWTVVEATE